MYHHYQLVQDIKDEGGRDSRNKRGTGRLKGNHAKGAATLESKCCAWGRRRTGRDKLGKSTKHNLVRSENNSGQYQVSEKADEGD